MEEPNDFVDVFILDIPWDEHQNEMLELEKITKQDIIDFANFQIIRIIIMWLFIREMVKTHLFQKWKNL